jgi:2-amino-4-hydroxy-6-hydroxymethyldihydropteridine diphosphokinase
MKKMAKVYFLIGGNLGDRELILKTTIDKMIDKVGEKLELSSIYETEPWGFEHEQTFLNQLVVLETSYSAIEVLDRTQEIEKEMGRVRKKNRYSERTIDIDILFYNDEVINTERLEVPHPRIQERMFALQPLNEIDSDMIHPIYQKKIKELLANCEDKLEVKVYQKGPQ